MTQYIERYRSGQHRAVWDDLLKLDAQVRQEPILSEALLVVRETMFRVRSNLERLVADLESGGFEFGLYPDGEQVPGYRGALVPPDPEIDCKVIQLETLAGGPVPLSLYGFWKWVGSVNLVGLHLELADQQETLDPLWVDRIDVTLAEYDDWRYRREHDFEQEPFAAVIAPDALHKDNVSGGPPYAIRVPNPGADAVLLNEGSDSYFVNYLRVALDWAGYPGFGEHPKDFPEWLDELSEKLERF